jgi:pimeloyl-ACP methyl ester carboxylesterase
MLVHGAWHGAWSYERTKRLLEGAGANVVTFDLPGHGSDKTDIPQVTFEAYVTKVKNELKNSKTPVILVGHSLAGFIVSQAAEDMPEKVDTLVFIAAMVPHSGKTVFDLVNEDPDSELLKNLIFSEDKSWATVSEDTLYNGATAQQIAEAAPHLVRQATQPFFVPVATTERSFGRIEKAYIVCEQDKILSPAAQARLIEGLHIKRVASVPTGHVPHVENPAALADALLKVSLSTHHIHSQEVTG